MAAEKWRMLFTALREIAVEEADFGGCKKIPSAAWLQLRGAAWRKLKKVFFSFCFAESGEGAEVVLQLLAGCDQLEEVDFRDCGKIPAAAWEVVPQGAWPRLEKAWGIPEDQLRRIRGGQE